MSQTETDRCNELSNYFCDDFTNHPDSKLEYSEVFHKFKEYKFGNEEVDLQYFSIHCNQSKYGPKLINDFISNGLEKHLYVVYDVMYGERDSPDYNHDLLYSAQHCNVKALILEILDSYLHSWGHHVCETKFTDFSENIKLNTKLTDEEKCEILDVVNCYVVDNVIEPEVEEDEVEEKKE